MRSVYTVTMKNVSLATTGPTAQTLVFINSSTLTSIKILRCWCGQGGTATSQNLDVELVWQPTGFPTLTSSVPVATALNDQISKITGATTGAAGTSGTNASAEGSGTKTIIIPDSFNNLNGYVWIATPAEEIILTASQSSGFGLYLATAPTSGANWTAGVTFQEV
jgi:hypothetical protein